MVRPWTLARSRNGWALAVLLLTTALFGTRGLSLAVDFTGGLIFEVDAPEGLASVEDALREAGVDKVVLKRFQDQPSTVFIMVPQREVLPTTQSASLLVQQLTSVLKQRHVAVNRVEIIDPSVGRQLLWEGALPPVLAFVVATIYPAVRHGRRYLLSAAVTILGTMAIVLGLFLSAYIAFRFEFALISLVTMDGLAIAAAVIGAVYALRVGPSR